MAGGIEGRGSPSYEQTIDAARREILPDQLRYEGQDDEYMRRSIEKIRACAYLPIIRKNGKESPLLTKRLIEFVLSSTDFFTAPSGVFGLSATQQLKFNHFSVCSSLLARGCQPTAEDLDKALDLKQQRYQQGIKLKNLLEIFEDEIYPMRKKKLP